MAGTRAKGNGTAPRLCLACTSTGQKLTQIYLPMFPSTKLGKVNHYRFNTMPQYLTPKTALPLVVTGKALNRYTNILPNPVSPDRDRSSEHFRTATRHTTTDTANATPHARLQPPVTGSPRCAC